MAEKTRGPRQLVVETARWLNGERDPEPAIILTAETLRFMPRSGQPRIDPGFERELQLSLPPFEID